MGWVSNPGAGAPLTLTGAADVVQLAVRSNATQTTNPFEVRSSGNTAVAWVASNGQIASVNEIQARSGSGAATTIGFVGANPSGIGFNNNEAGSNLYRSGSGALSIDGTLKVVSGQVSPTAVSVNNYVAGQAPATSTQGTDTTPVSGTIFYGQVFIPANVTLTGISYLIGTVGGTNNAIVALYNNAGTLVANSATAGTLVGTLATMQRVPFTSTYPAIGPAMYWVSVSMNGTTARLRTHTFGDHATGSATGVFGTLGAIAPPSTFTANTAPYAMTY